MKQEKAECTFGIFSFIILSSGDQVVVVCWLQEQASWVCQCDDSVVQQLEQDFKKTLQQQNSLEQWSAWLEGVVNQCLKPHEGDTNFPKAARLTCILSKQNSQTYKGLVSAHRPEDSILL